MKDVDASYPPPDEPYEPYEPSGTDAVDADGQDSGGDGGGRRAPRRRGRGPVLVGLAIALVAGVSAVAALGLGGDDDGTSDGTPARSSRTVEVTRTTLVDQTEIEGALGYGPEVPFPIRAEGTVTWLPEGDKRVERGEAVLRVDDRPVVLLYGSLPMYRELGTVTEDEPPAAPGGTAGSSGSGGNTTAPGDDKGTGGTGTDTGRAAGGSRADGNPTPAPAPSPRAPRPLRGLDVKQFETNLSALGYTGFTVDDSFTELTARAVRAWQRDLGLPRTGRVGIGDVVYGPGGVRVASAAVRVGDRVSGNPVSYTSTSRMVTVNARADRLGWARRGGRVTVDLPDGRAVTGTVASVGRDATAPERAGGDGGDGGGAGEATVAVVITFADQNSLGRLESGPVSVRYASQRRADVLAVPVAALVALAEGGHGLERADAETSGAGSRFTPVTTGLFADGKVEVSGDGIREGTKVRIPR